MIYCNIVQAVAAAKELQDKLENMMHIKEAMASEIENLISKLDNAKRLLAKFDELSKNAINAGSAIIRNNSVKKEDVSILKLDYSIPSTMISTMVEKIRVDMIDAEVQLDPVVKDASEEILDALESQVYQLQVEVANYQQSNQASTLEIESLRAQVDALIKEKRTDIVLRYENDIAKLNQTISELSEGSLAHKTEKAKIDSKLKELKERAEKAELELKERDERDLKALNASEEKVILTTKVQKQREEIVLKAKAATAGNLVELIYFINN